MISHGEAHAGECTLSTPACHLENGKQLLSSDPKRAAEELLKSYQLDERTDTLTLYATALEQDKQYALSLETWQRVIVFRESELDAAKAATKAGSSRKRAEARTAATTIQKQMDDAAEAIIRLWAKVGRVRVQIPAGKQLVVTRGGVEVDVSKDVLVTAGRDELVFTGKDGSVARLTVEVPAGGSANVVAPEPTKVAAKPAAKPAGKPAPQKITQPKPPEQEPVASQKPEPAEEPAAPRQPELTATRTTEAPRLHTLQRVGIGLAAGSVVALGAAVTFGILAGNDYDDSREAGCSPDGQCPFGPAADLAERSNDRARLAQISAIGGGALLVTGVALFVVGRGKARRAAATDVTLRVNPSSAAIAWRF